MKLNKKKIVMLPVICLSAVALATVGFSTWIIGTQDQTDSVTVSATVGTVEDKRLNFGVKIGVGESEAAATSDSAALVFDALNDSTGSITSTVNSEIMSFYYEITISSTDVDLTSNVSSVIESIHVTLSDTSEADTFPGLISGNYIVSPFTLESDTEFISGSNLTDNYNNSTNHDNSTYVKTSYDVTVTSTSITITGQIGFGWGSAFNYLNPSKADDNPGTVGTSDNVVSNLKSFKEETSSKSYSLGLKFDLKTVNGATE